MSRGILKAFRVVSTGLVWRLLLSPPDPARLRTPMELIDDRQTLRQGERSFLQVECVSHGHGSETRNSGWRDDHNTLRSKLVLLLMDGPCFGTMAVEKNRSEPNDSPGSTNDVWHDGFRMMLCLRVTSSNDSKIFILSAFGSRIHTQLIPSLHMPQP